MLNDKKLVYMKYKHFCIFFDVLAFVTIEMDPVLKEVGCIHGI